MFCSVGRRLSAAIGVLGKERIHPFGTASPAEGNKASSKGCAGRVFPRDLPRLSLRKQGNVVNRAKTCIHGGLRISCLGSARDVARHRNGPLLCLMRRRRAPFDIESSRGAACPPCIFCCLNHHAHDCPAAVRQTLDLRNSVASHMPRLKKRCATMRASRSLRILRLDMVGTLKG